MNKPVAKKRRGRTPSTAVAVGGGVGTPFGGLIEIAFAASGHPLPPGTGSLITGAIGSLVGYFAPGGRKGESE